MNIQLVAESLFTNTEDTFENSAEMAIPVILTVMKEEKEEVYGEEGDMFPVSAVKEERDEEVDIESTASFCSFLDEIPPPAAVTLHPVKEEEDEDQLLEVDPLQMLENKEPVEENPALVSKMEPNDDEERDDMAVIYQTFSDLHATGAHNGSRENLQQLQPNGRNVDSVCIVSFKKSDTLNAHLRMRTGQHPFQCLLCGTAFSQSDSLRRHIRTHTGERPFQCTECSTLFTRKSILKQHMRTHTGERPFKCTECSASFSQKGSLKQHMGSHTGERPFKCSDCGTSFSRKNNLKQHMRTHTGERPFQCTECGTTFSHKRNLKQHMQIHTGVRPFQCLECGMTFSQKGHLIRHRRLHTEQHP